MLDSLANWVSNPAMFIEQHANLLAIIGALSFVLLVASLVASPWLLAKFPTDYFSNPTLSTPKSAAQVLISVVRTVIGLIFALLGLLMIITPGPGLVVLIAGVALCDFPGKHLLLSRLVSQPSVLTTLNWLRAKAKKPPFETPSFR